MLPSIEDARKGIKEVHFLPFNPTDKRTAMTYITPDGKMHRATKGAPEQILTLVANRQAIETKVHEIINKYAEHGLRSLGVAYQVRYTKINMLCNKYNEYDVCFIYNFFLN